MITKIILTDIINNKSNSETITTTETDGEIVMTTETDGSIKFTIEGTENATIDWGDGSEIEKTYQEMKLYADKAKLHYRYEYSHEYSTAKAHTIIIKGKYITHFNCELSNITSLDVSKSTALINLQCNYCGLTGLDVSKNTAHLFELSQQ